LQPIEKRTQSITYNGQIKNASQAPVAHPCNPNYSGDRDQEDLGSKPAQPNNLSKKKSQKKKKKSINKKGLVEALSSSPSTGQKKRKKKKKEMLK
jgi:hypothetical protein